VGNALTSPACRSRRYSAVNVGGAAGPAPLAVASDTSNTRMTNSARSAAASNSEITPHGWNTARTPPRVHDFIALSRNFVGSSWSAANRCSRAPSENVKPMPLPMNTVAVVLGSNRKSGSWISASSSVSRRAAV
jgi:hypothetical protein